MVRVLSLLRDCGMLKARAALVPEIISSLPWSSGKNAEATHRISGRVKLPEIGIGAKYQEKQDRGRGRDRGRDPTTTFHLNLPSVAASQKAARPDKFASVASPPMHTMHTCRGFGRRVFPVE